MGLVCAQWWSVEGALTMTAESSEFGKAASIVECRHGVKRQPVLPLAQAVLGRQPLGILYW